jgi:hypothetical protein
VLPNISDHITSGPYTPWTHTQRPLAWFVRQFQGRVNPVQIQDTWLFTITCHGELLRGSTATGAAKNGTVQWPPTFNAHIDQDVTGEPLKSLGMSFLFTTLPLRLLNVWMPLNEAQVRPLALMDISKIKAPMVAKWSEVTFGTQNDRFFVTTDAGPQRNGMNDEKNAEEMLWWFDSQIAPGEAIIFDTTMTPHTSFGRPKTPRGSEHLAENIRYSAEMRCVSFLIAKDTGVPVVTALLAILFVVTCKKYQKRK